MTQEEYLSQRKPKDHAITIYNKRIAQVRSQLDSIISQRANTITTELGVNKGDKVAIYYKIPFAPTEIREEAFFEEVKLDDGEFIVKLRPMTKSGAPSRKAKEDEDCPYVKDVTRIEKI